ncbi:MAG: hypothetical protein A2722_01235 [Candidatus Doudnabacteria bacterium RIFCSPHIGHO2_01_FULL_50_11]|uniref:DUF5667 domain-containing protein n=1 Tax=Candidatus Doudnabacteria bacterium RIFCSPHIGHO2_01_FULL_50_11 TaxID=1817828 RepID=A0A1F5PE70_9BACT|nr:MAG: hypothetical protein A2722_01235 [Candidatus Doudnabacteria bacterium RIFCSPHIGHO2_01_FULL_50_11]
MRYPLKIKYAFAFLAVVMVPLPVLAADFDPGFLVDDQSFGDYGAFGGAAGVQRFLEVRGSMLSNTNIDFLRKLKEPADADLKTKLGDPSASLGRLRTAAELIYDASQQARINPQVILTTLQKEQSLIDGNFSDPAILQRRLDRAMGFGCPDSGSCGDLFLGFYFQLFGNLDSDGSRYLGAARSLARNFYYEENGRRVGRGPVIDALGNAFGTAPKVRAAQAGDKITVENTQGPPNNAAATQTFTIVNAATAALYRYTPHVYNGNYNFWKFYHQWFRYANGSLIKLAYSEQIYFIDDGERRLVSGTVLTLRKLDVTKAYILSQTEFEQYPEAKPLPPPDLTLVSPSSGIARYIVQDNILHPISDFVINQRKLDVIQTIYLPDQEVATYEVGAPALPPEGTLLKSASMTVVYLVQSSVLRPISGFVFQQRGYKFPGVVVASDFEVSGYPKGTTLPPLDGTLVKSATSTLVYYTALGQKFPVPYFVFKLRNYKFSSVVTLGDDEVGNLALGSHLAPADGTLIKAAGSATVLFVQAGSTHYISGFIFKYRNYKFSSVVEVTPEELALLQSSDPLYLEDDLLVKVASNPTVYIVQNARKAPLSAATFKARGFKFLQVVEIPQAEADRYPTDPAL